jgi:toluene monooxygenase system protein E
MTPREIRAARAQGPARRTYLCLEGLRRKPNDYEITSTALLYHPGRGFEVETPTLAHYGSSKLRSERWDSFEDPASFTYGSYVAERRDQEAFLDRLLERSPQAVPVALSPLLGSLSALRFPLHGLQMVAAYVGAFAPSGRITIAAGLQAADEMRRIQRLCGWLSRSGRSAAEIDALGRQIWHEDRNWQPLRRVVEELLVTYDWGEALVGLSGVVKPLVDQLWFEQLASVAERHDDEVLEKILLSLGDDGRWHRRWFVAFSRLALASDAANDTAMQGFVRALRPRASEATQATLAALDGLFGDDAARARVWRELGAGLSAHLQSCGISSESNGGDRA